MEALPRLPPPPPRVRWLQPELSRHVVNQAAGGSLRNVFAGTPVGYGCCSTPLPPTLRACPTAWTSSAQFGITCALLGLPLSWPMQNCRFVMSVAVVIVVTCRHVYFGCRECAAHFGRMAVHMHGEVLSIDQGRVGHSTYLGVLPSCHAVSHSVMTADERGTMAVEGSQQGQRQNQRVTTPTCPMFALLTSLPLSGLKRTIQATSSSSGRFLTTANSARMATKGCSLL